jgi:GTPase SAR1 family protein
VRLESEPHAGDLWLIDGPSGAGKSSLAERLLHEHPTLQLVRLDDVYPGWHGLAAAIRAVGDGIVAPYLAGDPGRCRLWDWAADAPGGWLAVDPTRPLLVEGCGSFGTTPPSGDSGRRRIWVDAEPAERKRRAHLRDSGAFDPWWNIWDAQWRAYTGAARPEAGATEWVVS